MKNKFIDIYNSIIYLISFKRYYHVNVTDVVTSYWFSGIYKQLYISNWFAVANILTLLIYNKSVIRKNPG